MTVDARHDEGHLRFVDHAMPELDRSWVARGDASRSDAWRAVLGALARSATTRDAVELGVIAGRVGFDALAASIRPAGDRTPGFFVPVDERTAGLDELRLWVLAASRAIGSSYPPESWPCVLSRDLPWLFVDASRGWGPTWLELQRLLTEDRAGPLGWWVASAVLDLRGAAEPARMTAGWAGRRCTFERFWRDVEVLCGSESPLRTAVLRVGAAWRLRAAGLSPATAAAMAAAPDDLAAARIGAEVLWNAGLGDLLRHDLAKRAAPR